MTLPEFLHRYLDWLIAIGQGAFRYAVPIVTLLGWYLLAKSAVEGLIDRLMGEQEEGNDV